MVRIDGHRDDLVAVKSVKSAVKSVLMTVEMIWLPQSDSRVP